MFSISVTINFGSADKNRATEAMAATLESIPETKPAGTIGYRQDGLVGTLLVGTQHLILEKADAQARDLRKALEVACMEAGIVDATVTTETILDLTKTRSPSLDSSSLCL